MEVHKAVMLGGAIFWSLIVITKIVWKDEKMITITQGLTALFWALYFAI